MSYFLSNVVKKVLSSHPQLENVIFIYPNRRTGIYLKSILKEQLPQNTFSPELKTFEHLAESITGRKKTDSIDLLFDFYKVYTQNTDSNKIEPFEDFMHWANILLDDFNDIDNYLINTQTLFYELKDINNIENWSPNNESNKYRIFIQKIDLYYDRYREFLTVNGKAYQGMLFKDAVDELQHFVKYTNQFFVFVGFSILKKTEDFIIQELLLAGKATIYWDIPDTFKTQFRHQQSFFEKYKSTWLYYKNNPFDNLSKKKIEDNEIQIIGVPKKIGLIKYVGKLLEVSENVEKTSIVLADENLLVAFLNAIPKSISTLNITMGLPIKLFSISNFLKLYFELHINYDTSKKGYYHKKLFKILRHPLLQADTTGLIHYLVSTNKIYFSSGEIEEFLAKEENNINNTIIKKIITTDKENNYVFYVNQLFDVLKGLKSNSTEYEKELLYQHFILLQKLFSMSERSNIIKDLSTFYSIYKKIESNIYLNFIGEPIAGTQLMGLLETQGLSFDELILTPVNEGTFPKNKMKITFIPTDVRLRHQLPTYIEEEMFNSYLFERMIANSKKIKLIYNVENDSFGAGEISRYLSNVLYKQPRTKHIHANVKQNKFDKKPIEISKNKTVIAQIEVLLKNGISPSALTTYIYNPIDFYKQKILYIDEIRDVEESIAENTLGTVIHDALEMFYTPYIGKYLNVDILELEIKNAKHLVQTGFIKHYKNGNLNEGKNRLIYEIALHFVNRFINQEIRSLRDGNVIKILELEKKISGSFQFESIDFPVLFNGIIDRIDVFNDTIRIIDYKTGKVEKRHLNVSDFDTKIHDSKYSKAFQILIYSTLYLDQFSNKEVDFMAGIISFKNHKSGFLPIYFDEKYTDTNFSLERKKEILQYIEKLIMEILNPNIPFVSPN